MLPSRSGSTICRRPSRPWSLPFVGERLTRTRRRDRSGRPSHGVGRTRLRCTGPSRESSGRNRNEPEQTRGASRLRSGRLTDTSFRVVSVSESQSPPTSLAYPVVVKPLALSGSQGVIRADDAESLAQAMDRVSRLLRTTDMAIERENAHEYVLIETFIPGKEYAVEGVLTDGAFQVFTIFDKPDSLDGPFFEETIYVTPSRASPRRRKRSSVRSPRRSGFSDYVMVPCTPSVA